MRLHIAEKTRSSWSMRPWLLMKTAGIAFEEVEHRYDDNPAEQRRRWQEFSPTSQVPVLQDGEQTVWDTLAICLYLGERYPQIWPQAAAARAWAYSACAEMHAGFAALREQCNFTVQPQPDIQPDASLMRELRRLNELWNEGLQNFGGEFLADSRFGAVDAFYAPVVLRIRNYGLSGHFSTAAREYMQRILQLQAVREWCGI